MPGLYQEARPWGSFKILHEMPAYKVKEIVIKPGSRLSYQAHRRRSEHWLIVSGEAQVMLDDREIRLAAGESLDVVAGAKHRVGNTGKTDLIFIEIQRGDYFGEDDITRYADDYGRAP